jgi:hypothetical protein
VVPKEIAQIGFRIYMEPRNNIYCLPFQPTLAPWAKIAGPGFVGAGFVRARFIGGMFT